MANFQRALSPRLQLLFDQLLPGLDVWDLCCDHGYLGLKAHAAGVFRRIHFVDSARHLIESLQKRFGRHEGLYFHSLPAEKLGEKLQGNVIAAGVGAELICRILHELTASGVLAAERLVLGPHKDAEKLQEWLGQDCVFSASYSLLAVREVFEKGRRREVFVFSRRNQVGEL